MKISNMLASVSLKSHYTTFEVMDEVLFDFRKRPSRTLVSFFNPRARLRQITNRKEGLKCSCCDKVEIKKNEVCFALVDSCQRTTHYWSTLCAHNSTNFMLKVVQALPDYLGHNQNRTHVRNHQGMFISSSS